ncbi:uncharacterized protein LOC111640590 [Centruroides sculpturatus]|uniref:uncharacterized protein LOC111640590 n=1 Tax=Centruroides sculpturatus TaxID=218467 RepID=UPI000C6D11DE|nr:uncharacterized protein LOC111640590 [Centruroides sculpturatus]
MERHLNSIEDLVDELTASGEQMSDRLMGILMLGSLPDNYNTLMTALEARADTDLTLGFVKIKIMEEYEKQSRGSLGHTMNMDEAMALKTMVRKQKTGCYNCGGHHLKKDCPELGRGKKKKEYKVKLTEVQEESDPLGNEETHECHSACVSTQNMPLDMKQCLAVKTTRDWYVDSAATADMTNNRNFFRKLNNNNSEIIRVADGREVPASGIGHGELICDEGSSNGKLKFDNVLYVPQLNGNLLSVLKMMHRGYDVYFDSKTMQCYIKRDGETHAKAELRGSLFVLSQHNALQVLSIPKKLCTSVALEVWPP